MGEKKILIVSDTPDIKDLLSAMLVGGKHDLYFASSRKEAEGMIRAGSGFDIVITKEDLGSGSEGFDVAHTALCQNPECRCIIIWFRTLLDITDRIQMVAPGDVISNLQKRNLI